MLLGEVQIRSIDAAFSTRAPLIMAAAPFELTPLRAACEPLRHSPDFLEIGIGALAAAKNCDRVCEIAKGRDVILIGTAGTFGRFDEVTLCRATKALWLPTCERHGLAYSVKGTTPEYQSTHWPRWASTLEEKIALCGPTVSISDKLPREFSPKDCIETLELYSIADAVERTAASFLALFAITNAVGPNSHIEWKANHERAAAITAQWLMENCPKLSKTN